MDVHHSNKFYYEVDFNKDHNISNLHNHLEFQSKIHCFCMFSHYINHEYRDVNMGQDYDNT